MAEHDQWRLLCFERRQRLRNAAHWDQLATFDVSLLKFKRFADIHQAQLFAGIEPLFYFAWCDLKWFGHSLSLARFLPIEYRRYHYELGPN